MKTYFRAPSAVVVALLMIMFAFSGPAMALDPIPERERDTSSPCEPRTYRFADHRWFFDIGAYLWPAATIGNTELAGEQSELAGSTMEAIENFDIGAGVQLEVGWCRISMLVDFLYMDLGFDQDDGTQDLTKFVTTAVLHWGFAPHELVKVGPVAGVRHASVTSGLEIDDGIEVEAAGSFFSPVVGLRARIETPVMVYVPLYADIGGLGLGADITWQAFGGVGVELGRANLELGYRHLYIDYTGDELTYDVATSGPQLGVRFSF